MRPLSFSQARITRGPFLPHIEIEGVPLFVTFRLYDSLPSTGIEPPPPEAPEPVWRRYRKHLEDTLDEGHGSCFLARPEVASILRERLLAREGRDYDLHAWCIMPNHAHTFFTRRPGVPLKEVIRLWKGGSSRESNLLLGRKGEFWQRDYFDRLVFRKRAFDRVTEYIERNPVAAGLVSDPAEWRFSSAGERRVVTRAGRGRGASTLH